MQLSLSRSERTFKIIALTLVGGFSLLAFFPVVYAFSASISGKIAYETGQVVLTPVDTTLDVYQLIYLDKGLWISFTNTLFYTIFGTAWSLFMTITGAYALGKDVGCYSAARSTSWLFSPCGLARAWYRCS